MGTDVQIVVPEADHELLDSAMAEIDDLERRWSRFIPGSEVSQLNHQPGQPVIVSQPTFQLVAQAIDGWRVTYGRFDPTVHDALVAAGYDRPFDEIAPVVEARPTEPAPGAGGIVLDPRVGAITLPHGVRLDLGGIGKGAAADAVTESLLGWGATGAGVSLGGDVRVRGRSPFGASWPLAVELPRGEHRTIDMVKGAACTSTRNRRRWSTSQGPAHHLIDPASGHPVDSDVAAVTVCAADAVCAEIVTKSAFVLGANAAAVYLEELGLDALVVDDRDRIIEVGRLRQPTLETSR